MSLIKRDQPQWPRDYLSNMLNQFLRPFEEESTAEATLWSPAVDIQEKNDKYIVTADLPGIEKENIHLSLENNVLTIRGERHYEKAEKQEGFAFRERAEGRFYRRFTLPEATDESKVKAKYKKGVLEIVIPKRQNTKAKSIEVRIEE